MNCEQARAAIPLLADGELDALAAQALERHLEGCAGCRARRDALAALRTAARGATYHRAPATLRARLRRALAEEAGAAPAPKRRRWEARVPLAFAAGVLFALLPMLYRANSGGDVERELVAAHVRSLMAGHLSDVASTDRHTVKPWFAGKLDFAPPVSDFADAGYPLEGGRLDYIAGRPVAALVYRHRRHVINLFVWPDGGADEMPVSESREGYALVRWRRDGMKFWAVSDLNAAELTEFGRQVVSPDAGAPRRNPG